MSMLQPVSRSRHAGRRWQRPTNYRFAAATVLAPLAVAEVSQATLALPLAFVQRDDHWTLAAVLGLLPGLNFYVDEAGNWLGRYIPAMLRSHPFLLGAHPNGEATLCIDEGSGLVTGGPEGELFFDESGMLGPLLNQIMTFLTETARSEFLLVEGCEILAQSGVIEIWPLTIHGEHGIQEVSGLYRVNEAKLNALDDAVHAELRRRGMLGVAYSQLLSMGNLVELGRLAQARAQRDVLSRSSVPTIPESSLINLPNDSTIDWDWSKIGR